MWWISISEYAGTAASLNERVIPEGCVLPGLALWQVAQPTDLNSAPPVAIDCEDTCCPFNTTPPGGGGARFRMKLAKAETSSRIAGPVDPGLLVSYGYPAPARFKQFDGNPVCCWSSPGNGRSCMNNRLEIPISTL